MPHRRWTVLIVPSDNSGTRTFTVSERARRILGWSAGIAGALVVAAVTVLFTPWGTPGARLLLAENSRLNARLAVIDTQLIALNDTLAAIGQREQQMRLFAGITPDSTSVAADLAAALPQDGRAVANLSPRLRRPFLGRLGFSGSPDIGTLISRATELASSFRAVSDTLTVSFERLSNTPSIMPTTGWLSSHFTRSRFHPVLHASLPHEGIDLSAPMGAPIVAPASGVVKSAGYQSGYGNTFEIDHGNGIVTKFAHCSRIVVRRGQAVTRGQLIATVGNTGLSTGPHLHYEVHVNGKPVDPLKYVLPEKIAD